MRSNPISKGRLAAYLGSLALLLALAAIAPFFIAGRGGFGALYEDPELALETIQRLQGQQASLLAGQPHVAYMGDSSLYDTARSDTSPQLRRSIPELLQGELAGRAAAPAGLKVISACRWGYTGRDFLCLHGMVASSRPAVVIATLNLRGMLSPWPAYGKLDFLLGWRDYLALRAQGQASLGFWAWLACRADWLMTQGQGARYACSLLNWYRMQDRDLLEFHSSVVQRPPRVPVPGPAEVEARVKKSIEARYLKPLAPGDPGLACSEQLGQAFRAMGIKVFFYIVPVNLAAIERAWGREGVARALRNRDIIRSEMEKHGFKVHDYFARIPDPARFSSPDEEHFDHRGRQQLAAIIAGDLCADMGWR